MAAVVPVVPVDAGERGVRIMQRIKLFTFYQIMAFASLFRPETGLEMIDAAAEAQAGRDQKFTIDSIFSHARKGRRS